MGDTTPEITEKISGIEILLFTALAVACVALIATNLFPILRDTIDKVDGPSSTESL